MKRHFDSSLTAGSLPNGAVQPLAARASKEHGQSLIETALILPLLLLLAFDAINFGYFFYTAVNLASAPRQGVEWSIQGPSTPSNLILANAGPTTDITSVSFLTYEDMRGALPSSSNARVQVCSSSIIVSGSGVNGTGTNQRSNCLQFGSGSETWTPAPDPEAPNFVLNRVDVVYQITPLIPQFSMPVPGGVINLSLLPNLRMHRQVSMRSM